ncbi:MAG: NBR1-Ig-like domain-containing protein [Anaerolineaceae bacterium]|jgi:hypothetical protein
MIKMLKTKRSFILATLLLAAIVLAACNMPNLPGGQSTGDPVEIAIQTLQVKATQDYFLTSVAQMTSIPQATNINEIPATPPVVVTTVVTTTPESPSTVPTSAPAVVAVTPLPTRVQPTPTATPVPCNWAGFVSDVTIPDGTTIAAGTTFTKTWRLKNIGSCIWDTRYDMAFVKGDQMGAPSYVDMPKDVKPGETIDLSVTMTAPTATGNYTGYFALVNPNGVKFGLNASAKDSFWVSIKVGPNKGEVFSFTSRACDATWSTGAKNPIPCPGDSSKVNEGFVQVVSNFIREDGGKEDETALITRPNASGTIYIMGIYPEFTIKSGDRFKATLMCAYKASKCDIDLGLNYRIGKDGTMTNIQVWDQKYDGKWENVDVDLSFLAGKTVQFILVSRQGGSTQDMTAVWLHPAIFRE